MSFVAIYNTTTISLISIIAIFAVTTTNVLFTIVTVRVILPIMMQESLRLVN